MMTIYYSWPSSFALAIILSMIVSAAVGYVFYKFFWATIGITGLFSGYFLGSFAYAMLIAITGYQSDMLMALSAGSMATIGCYYAYRHGDKLALGLTSVIGPYFIMRGFSFIFGGYPCEVELIKWINGGSKVSLHWMFIVYISGFVLLAVLSFMF